MNIHVKTGDAVIVISGEDKGKKGKVQKAFPETNRVIVEGVAMVKKHQKPRGQGMPGGIVEKEAAICLSAPSAGSPPASVTSSRKATASSPAARCASAKSAAPSLTINEGGQMLWPD